MRKMRWMGLAVLAPAVVLGVPEATAQTMPGEAYHSLLQSGNEKLARRIQKQLDMREDPSDNDVSNILERWDKEAGGPDTGYEWVTVARLWTRAGKTARAEMALSEADATGEVPAAVLLLDQARIAFLGGDLRLGQEAYWAGCAEADQGTALQYWLDVEVLATPGELEAWDRFRRLSASQTDLCRFLRRFWGERTLASTMDIGMRMGQHYRRVRFAQTHYRRRSGKKGPSFSSDVGRPRNAAYDDRGLVYIRMGEADRSTSFAGNPGIQNEIVSAECYQPNESWAYDYPEGTRVYHFTTFSGTDDYWLIENLGMVYRCGAPEASGQGLAGSVHRLTPINESRAVILGPAASLVLQDLYRSRQGLDPRYAQAAQRMSDPRTEGYLYTGGSKALESQRVLHEERSWTYSDAEFAITEVPERPSIKPDSRLMVETLQFRSARPQTNRVWVNALIEGDKLSPRLEGGAFIYQVDARLGLIDESGDYQQFDASFGARSSVRLTKDQSLPVRVPIDLPNGNYRYTLVVSDALAAAAERRSGNYFRDELTVRELGGALPVTSDVAVVPDSGGHWQPLAPTGPDLGMLPSPAHLTGPDGVAHVYFEAYNLTPGGRYETRLRFEPEDGGGDAFDLTFPGEVPHEGAPRTRRTLRLDLKDTEPGTYRMSVTVTDSNTGRTTLPQASSITVTGG